MQPMTWAIYFSTSVDLRQLMYWMMGGFGGVDWRQSWLMLALIPVLLWDLLSVQAGEYVSTWRDLGAATGFTPVVLAQCVGRSDRLDGWRQCGAGGCYRLYWSGDPAHILRLCGLTDHRVLLPGCALAGASALLLADIVARLALAAAELPIGVVTATLGAPVFIWLLLKAGR